MTSNTSSMLPTTVTLATEDFTIASDTPGIDLHIRNKRSASMKTFCAERTLLMVHGATYSSESLFDVELGGVSFMDYLAGYGYDVYAVDVRGYGGSSRPPEMDQPAEQNAPVVRTEVGVRDVASAVAFILERLNISKLNLLGMSWGGTLAGTYTSQNNDSVNKLVLIAPQWLSTKPVPIDRGGMLGAYRVVSLLDTKERWLSGVPEDKKSELIPRGWFEKWANATLATDPGNKMYPNTIRVPNGAILDIREFWTAGRKVYDPKDILVPVLLVHAEWDRDVPIDLAQSYFVSLTGAPYRRWVEIGEGTHVVVLEENRMQVFQAIQNFLDEQYSPAV